MVIGKNGAMLKKISTFARQDLERKEMRAFNTKCLHFVNKLINAAAFCCRYRNIIREKILRLMDKEVPHGIAVSIEKMREREDKDILAWLFCALFSAFCLFSFCLHLR